LIDQVIATSSWPAGSNITKQTMERDLAGGWQTSVLPGGTPGMLNSVPTTTPFEIVSSQTGVSTTPTSSPTKIPETVATGPAVNYATNQVADAEIEITEILPNPKGSDAAGEFIELFNAGSAAVDLTGWKMVVGEHQYIITASTSRSNILQSRLYLTLWRGESKLVLPNDQGQVLLYSPEKTIPRQVVSYEKAPDGKSFAKNDLSEWRWSEQATPGSSNVIKADNQPPEVDWSVKTPIEVGEAILFDSSDTTDPEDDKLTFAWQFGDGASSTEPSPKHAYQKSGRFKAELSVSDGKTKATKERTLVVSETKASSTLKMITPATTKERTIIINEFLPNPVGEDSEGEWIELYNSGKVEIDMLNWQLDDAPGGSKAYQFSDNVIIKPSSYYLVNREDSSLALNNGTDEVRLFDYLGTMVDSVAYSGAKEGLSYARDSHGRWQWTSPTPGKVNQAAQIINIKKTTVKKTGVVSKSKVAVKKTTSAKTTQWLTVSGTVTALPGQIAKQTFYVAGNDCWQIYNYRRDFPKLKLGDQVQVYGLAETIKGEKRIKTSKLADVKILGVGGQAKPATLKCQQVGIAELSKLVKVSGELTKKTATLWYVDDGSGEVAVYLSKAIADNFSGLTEGEQLEVVGLVTPATTGVRIVPRSIVDILTIKTAEAKSYSEVTASIPARDSAVELKQYLQLVLLGLILASFGWWLRKRYAM